uniref:Uncharacterized protein n=1 Tax=Arundo donax TaxID=35708 RepID=A0A0A9A6S5_ARUDO
MSLSYMTMLPCAEVRRVCLEINQHRTLLL